MFKEKRNVKQYFVEYVLLEIPTYLKALGFFS